MRQNRILIVDDSRLLHRVYETFLVGFELLHAYDGVQALELLGRHREVDVVLLDVNMPRMGGLELLARLKADGAHRHIPVVLVTTQGEEASTAAGLRAGAVAYVKKPFHFATVLEILARVTGRPAVHP